MSWCSFPGLEGLEKIWSLYVDGNRIAVLRPLSKLKWLSSLDLRKNQIQDLSPLAELSELKYLAIEKNEITDLTVLVQMAEKDAEGEQRFAPFWRIYVAGNPLSEKANSEQLERLKELGGRVSEEPIPD